MQVKTWYLDLYNSFWSSFFDCEELSKRVVASPSVLSMY